MSIGAGQFSSYAVKGDGTVWAWGRNASGQLGDNTTTRRELPVLVQGLSNIAQVAAGDRSAFALKKDGTVYSWGYNANGQLGTNDNVVARYIAAQLPDLSGVTMLAPGHEFGLALKNDGTVWSWGGNSNGQVGDQSETDRPAPTPVTGLSGVLSISGGARHAVAVKSDSTVWAWGDNEFGQLGTGSAGARVNSSPVRALGGYHPASVAAGDTHNVVISHDGSLWTWGRGAEGQLGNGTDQNASSMNPLTY